MRRREVITLLGGVATAWPFVARAQRGERVRRVGALIYGQGTDREIAARLAAFRKTLQDLGWTPDANLLVDVRFGVNSDDLREKAKELIGLAPDVVLATPTPSVIELLKVTRTIPIVFAAVTDPAGFGIVQSLARPGAIPWIAANCGVALGLASAERMPTFRTPGAISLSSSNHFVPKPNSAERNPVALPTPSVGVELRVLPTDDDNLIESGISDFARSGGGGLIALRLIEVITHRQLIIKLAAQHLLPAIYPLHVFAVDGGLISYGPDLVDEFRRAAGYVDRILKGEKPADLPVQAPTKLELVINLKTAKALGLTVPPAVLGRADEVIE